MRLIGLIALLTLLFHQAAVFGIQVFASLLETPVSAAKIAPPETLATCPHHLQGCPKDCLCPKTHQEIGADASDAEAPGAIREPSLVACTEHGTQSPSLALEAFLVGETCRIRYSDQASSLVLPEEASPQEGCEAPPLKVPIA